MLREDRKVDVRIHLRLLIFRVYYHHKEEIPEYQPQAECENSNSTHLVQVPRELSPKTVYQRNPGQHEAGYGNYHPEYNERGQVELQVDYHGRKEKNYRT